MLTVEKFEFNLKNALMHNDGETNTLYLSEPLGQQQRYYEILDGLLSRALFRVGSEFRNNSDSAPQSVAEIEETTDEQKKQTVLFALTGLGNDAEKFYETFRQMLLSGVCYLDQEKKTPLKSGWLSMLRPAEFKNLVVEYASRWLFPKFD